jgi:hypothetical protein
MHPIPRINLVAGVSVVAVLLYASLAHEARAAIVESKRTYNVSHGFRLAPGGNIVPTVTANFFEHAWVRDPILRSDVNPPAQPAGFDNGGFEQGDSFGRIWNYSRNGKNNGQVQKGNFAIPAAGIALPGAVRTAFVPPAPPAPNWAVANSRFVVNPFLAGGPITGGIKADGEAHAFFDTVKRAPNPSEAYAFSYAQITARGGRQLRNGQIQWRPQISTAPVFGSSFARGYDPIDFTILDLVTGDSVESVLLDISYDIRGLGSLEWDSTTGYFSIDAKNAEFHIDITSPFTLQQGILDLEIVDGLITVANDTGIFDGVLPSVGTPGAFLTTLGDITLDYDFGEFGGHDLDIAANFGGGGSAHVVAIPEPSSFSIFTAGIALVLGYRKRRCPRRR